MKIYSQQPFDLEAFLDRDYAGASLDRKSITGGCQFLGKRLISWQCKKQTIVANSTTKAEYVVAANFLWIDHNVADLLTKAFDVSSDELGVKTGSCKVNAARQDLVLLGEIGDNTSKGFWATAKSKTVNDVKQIHATVDGKTMVISESSVRSDLHFNDEDGITCLSNDEIFVNLALMGGPPKKVGDEVVYTREDNRVVRAATTATSLEAEQESEVNTSRSGEDSMDYQDDLADFVPPTPHDLPLSGAHTPESDEGRPNINELMAICTNLSNRVLALETSKTAQDLVIKKLKKKSKDWKRSKGKELQG
ncbi:hypothetical protein Tco_0876731 [Tanacetum coccineum]|uniref:Uncharacterized protein n=1 Tax=Tanacetum coccineum TaxID=301880 RepID=A0ABQ5BT45_9ASTR